MNTTSDPADIVEKLRNAKPGSGSALYDAIFHGMHESKAGSR